MSPAAASTGRPRLVLVPGWGMTAAAMQPWVDTLVCDWEVAVVELPGHGAAPGSDFTLPSLRRHFLEQTSVDAVWLGWSLGGEVCLQLASELQPRGLVLVACSPRFCRGEGWSHGVPAGQIEAMEHGLRQDPSHVWRGFLRLLASRGEGARKAVRQLQGVQSGPDCDTAALAAGLRYLRNTDLRGMLPDIRVPTLWLAGDHDPLVSRQAVEWAATRMPAGECVIIDGAGHVPFYSHEDRVAAELRRLHPLHMEDSE